MRSERWLPRGFLILLLAVLALAGWQWRHGAPLSANLMDLVPGDAPDALELSAEQAKVSNAHLSEAELTEAVEEALDWARKR